MKKGNVVVTLALLIGLPLTAQAAKYGLAGCGLGSIVFGDEPGMIQILAATTNGTAYSQSFGITTGTSNCDSGDATASLDQETFLHINYASVARDAAVGQGEYLAAFATLLGCESGVHAEFFGMTQAQHSALFVTEDNAAETLAKVKDAVASTPNLAASCERI